MRHTPAEPCLETKDPVTRYEKTYEESKRLVANHFCPFVEGPPAAMPIYRLIDIETIDIAIANYFTRRRCSEMRADHQYRSIGIAG